MPSLMDFELSHAFVFTGRFPCWSSSISQFFPSLANKVVLKISLTILDFLLHIMISFEVGN